MVRADDVNHGLQHDLDEMSIAKTAREEKKRARDEKLRQQQENERMAKLYREHILKEPPASTPELVQLGGIAPAKPAKKPRPSQRRSRPGNRTAFLVAHCVFLLTNEILAMNWYPTGIHVYLN